MSCNHLNPISRDGTSQMQRLLTALSPNRTVQVDERHTADWLNYAQELASHLRYYNADNQPLGDWRAFFANDISAIIARIAITDVEFFRQRFQNIYNTIHENPTGLSDIAWNAAQKNAWSLLFLATLTPLRTIDDWQRIPADGQALQGGLFRITHTILIDAVDQLQKFALRTSAVGLATPHLGTVTLTFVGELDPSPIADTTLFVDVNNPSVYSTNTQAFQVAAERVKAIFDKVFEGLLFLVNQAPAYLEDTLQRYPHHRPPIALYITFIKLLENAQTQLNGTMARHLDFYYQDVLHIARRAEVPDHVHLIFELARGFVDYAIAAKTDTKAGKDNIGKDLFYATDKDLIANNISLDEEGLKTIFIEKIGTNVANIFAAPKANTADGIAEKLNPIDGKWATFGSSGMLFAEVGFAIASPQLFLAEGTRNIDLTLTLNNLGSLDEHDLAELQANILFSISGKKGWIPVEQKGIPTLPSNASSNASSKVLTFKLLLKTGEPAAVAFDPSVCSGNFDTRFPVLRAVFDNYGLTYKIDKFNNQKSYTIGEQVQFEHKVYQLKTLLRTRATPTGMPQAWDVVNLNNKGTAFDPMKTYTTIGERIQFEKKVYQLNTPLSTAGFTPTAAPQVWDAVPMSYPYRFFENTELISCSITVDVKDMKTLILESDFGELNPAKPFLPFGPVPRVGGLFTIGSWEVFQKKLDNLSLKIEWAGLPAKIGTEPDIFISHYAKYTDLGDINKSYFKANVEKLENGKWSNVSNPSEQIVNVDNGGVIKTISPNGILALRQADLPPFTNFDTQILRGGLRLRLVTDFLHSLYPAYIQSGAKPPYTPQITQLLLDYTSTQQLDFNIDQFFQITPFGHVETYPTDGLPPRQGLSKTRRVVPSFAGKANGIAAEGALYIGLHDVQQRNPNLNQVVSILFQVAEGSENPETERQPIFWSYLVGNDWRDFAAADILSDSTNGLLTSGIVELNLPGSMDDKHTWILRGQTFWVRAAVSAQADAVCQTVAVFPQSVRATYRNVGNDPMHPRLGLAGSTISKLYERVAAVKTVQQPFASFGGRTIEESEAYYRRVSERLRHKQRVATIWDYEHLVLEQFADIYKAKCINHAQVDTSPNRLRILKSEFAAGYVTVIVVPNLKNKNAYDPLQPRVSKNRLAEIEAYVRAHADDFATISVVNPQYEPIKIDCHVRFGKNRDEGFFLQKLREDIVRFLSPWLYEDGKDLAFGGAIHRSKILQFVEERNYVDFVTNFKLFHKANPKAIDWGSPVEEANASTSASILISAKPETYNIRIANSIACEAT